MSGCGFRGRGFGPRGARVNGPTTGFGPRFQHPNFNFPRPPPNRLPGPDNWIERPNFPPWQPNTNFPQRPQFRGNLQFRPNGRGRAPNGRGMIRFSGPGRPPGSQFHFVRNVRPRAPAPQEEQIYENPNPVPEPQAPLLGSEEERQQKITETADKLKQKLFSITEEDSSTFWEDDLSALPNSTSEEEITQRKGIPELKHDPPELDLTFTDFRDIGRVDSNNPKFENVENIDDINNVLFTYTSEVTDKLESTNDEITIISEHNQDIEIIESINNETFVTPRNDELHEQKIYDLTNTEYDIENLNFQSDHIEKSSVSAYSSDTNEISLVTDSNRTTIDLSSIQSTNDSSKETSKDVIDVQSASKGLAAVQNQDASGETISHNEGPAETKVHTNDNVLGNLQQAEDNSQTSPVQEINQISVTLPLSSQSSSSKFPPAHEEMQSNTVSDLPLPIYSQYNEVHKSGEDKKLKNAYEFQPRIFNTPPRFNPRISGPRCRWTFQQGGKNLFFRGPQRLPIHGNRMPPPRHMVRFPQTDLVPITFDPRAPPPFTPNLPAPNHDSQHQTLLPFSSNDLPPSFDPTEPPPNVRSATVPEGSKGQDILQNVPPFDMRNQSGNVSSNNVEILQPPVVFDPREPPPRITTTNETLPNFNPQQPPPKVRNQEETFQPPPIFDPRLSSQERSKLITPLDTSGSNIVTMNLMETSQITDYSMASVAGNFSQLPINIPLPQTYMSNMQLDYQRVLPRSNSGQRVREYPVPPPPLPKNSINRKEGINQQHTLSMDDGLEDMQEAMEFAKQVMNMTGEMQKDHVTISQCCDVPLPSEIPVPNENINISCSVPLDQLNSNVTEKSKVKGNASKNTKEDSRAAKSTSEKKSKKDKVTVEERSIPDLCKTAEDVPLTNEHIRPKVVFNLNCKLKKISKPEEWQYESQVARQRKKSDGKKNNVSKNTNQQKERISEKPSVSYGDTAKTSEKLNDTLHHKPHNEKSHAQSSNVTASNNVNEQNLQKSKKQTKKADAPTSESSWKSRVISRFLKMSKNDICNMVNNSSLRKFDIAMKHLVKERRSSLSLEMRNIEDEKMKEYDREEFMNQLNAMLDPSAVVGITDLPTEFIHHLSEVLQLDPMPFESNLSSNDDANLTETANIKQKNMSRTSNPECTVKENEDTMINLTVEHEDVNMEHRKQSKSQDTIREKTSEITLDTQNEYSDNAYHHLDSVHLTPDPLQESSSSKKDNVTEKVHLDIETSHKKQLLFNEADFDNILSEVTERSNSISKLSSSQESRKSTSETHKTSTSTKSRGGSFNSRNESPQLRSRTVADLDDIFSATIGRIKPNKIISLDHSRSRKSTSEDRSTFRTEKYSRWSRKERENPDAFRNLTKEEWEAKYGRSMNTTPSSSCTRRSGSNSSENLFRERDNRNYRSQRYCSSDSPMRHLSISPLVRESTSFSNAEKYSNEYNGFEESTKSEQMDTGSSDSSTTSSSDDSEDTVSPNVTKLLKVIKEKEKIAKKKSLNETIRDEVAAEIEKKWKEKSKHKERKSRKRERRKRDKREKRKKERKKRRKRSSPCNESKYDEDFEQTRLLTEEEIKKEVIVKEEPDELLDTNDTSISGSSTASFMLCNRAIEPLFITHTESQDSQMPKQLISVASTMQLSVNSKPTIPVATTQQPKTKAQLKQMPESSDLGKKKQLENFVDVAVSNINIANTNNEQMKLKIRSTEIINNGNNVLDKVLPMSNDKVLPVSNDSLSQIDLPSNTVEIGNTEVKGDNDKSIKAIPSLLSTSSPAADVNIDNEHSNSRLSVTSTSGSMENKCGFKKIDIKAYKERALQRRLNQQSKSNEVIANSFQSLLDGQSTSASAKAQTELSSMENRVEVTVPDTDRGQSKYLESTEETESAFSYQESSYKGLEQKSNVELPHVSTEALQNISMRLTDNNGSSVFSNIEKSLNQIADFDSTKNQIPCKDSKTTSKSTSTKIVASKQVLHKSQIPMKSKLPLEDKNSKKPSIVDCNKFKNIRSEGSKELKLKKEKIKKLSEKKRTPIKTEKVKSSSLSEKHVEKYSTIVEQKPEDGMQKAKATDGKNASKSHTNTGIGYCDNSEAAQNKKAALTNRVPMIPLSSDVESMSNDENAMKPTEEHEFNREDNNEQSHVTAQQDIHDDKNKNDKVRDEENVTDPAIHLESLEGQQTSREENVDVQGIQATNEENEQRDTEEAETLTTKNNEAENIIRESVLIENIETKATNSEESPKDDLQKFSTTEFDVTDEVQNSTDKNEEPISVKDYTEINTNSNVTNSNVINNIEASSINQSIDKNSIPCTEMDSVTNNSNANTAEHMLEPDKDNDEFSSNTGISESISSEPKKITECQDLQCHELKSPESSGSPFKGFLVDSIEDDIREASELLNLQIKKDVEEKVPEDREKWLETCLDQNFDWKGIKENEKSISTNDEVSESVARENQNSNADLLQMETRDKDEVPNRGSLEKDNVRSMEESDVGKDLVEAGKSSPTMNIHIEETFDEDSEPFIILDEYIDDTDGKSIGKLSSTELDLEDCVATDTTVFLNKNFQEKEVDTVFNIKQTDLNSTIFKVLSEVSDKDVHSEVDEEEKGKSDFHSKDNAESKISLERNKSPDLREVTDPSIGTVFGDVSQQSTIVESLPTQISKHGQKSLLADDESENSFKDTTVPYQVTSPVVETSKKLNVPTKAALKKSVEDFLTRDESLGYRSPQQVSSLNEKVNDEVTDTGKNDIELNNNAENELVLHSAIDINVELDPVELGKSRDLDDTSRRKQKDEEKLDSRSHRKDDNDSLHKIRNKQKMKHKQDKKRKISEKKIKSAVQADTVQPVHPNTKESIMARMIEIDVEIHKLMTEKMTLYQMLKSTNLPDNTVQLDNVVKESKEAEVPIVRPHTPSALVSQLIQNIESSPVVSQSTKGIENTSSKDNTTDSQQSSKHKVSAKHEQSGSKRSSSSCTSVEEEVTHNSGSTKSSMFRKKKRQKYEKGGRSEDVSEVSTSAQETVEKKHVDTTKSVHKKVSNTVRQEATERKVEHVSNKSKNQGTVNDLEKKNSQNSEKNSSTKQSSSKTGKRSSETSSIQDPLHESDKSKSSDVRNESTLSNDNENEMRIQNDEETASSTSKVPDNRTPERLSMYSDDSTWESLLQNPGLDAIEQKKPSTGLALLEETYRKEIAMSRRMKSEARKKKKQQLRSLLRSVNTLTMEEEELPLCTLYIKKLQQKKSLLDSLDHKADELNPNENSQVWRNVVEVINAVAEDRIEDLYVEQLEKQSDDNCQTVTTEIPGVSCSALNEERLDSNTSLYVDTVLPHGEEIKKIVSCSSKSSDKIKPVVESNDKVSCETKRDAVNDSKRHESTTACNKARTESSASSTAKGNEPNKEDTTHDVNSSNTKVLIDSKNEQTIVEDSLSKSLKNNEPVVNLSTSTDNDINNKQVSQNSEPVSSLSKKVREEITDGNNQKEISSVLMTEKDCNSSDVYLNYEKSPPKLNTVLEKNSSEESNTHKEKIIVQIELQSEKVSGNIKQEHDNNVPNNEYFINIKEARRSQKKRKESERSNDTLSEDNFNESSSVIDNTDIFRNEDSLTKKSSKRKRQNSNTPLRRSSRYTEEITKRIKIEPDLNSQCNEQDFQDRNLHMYYPRSKSPTPLSSYDEEAENTPTNVKRSKGIQKLQNNRKRTMRSESEMSTNTLSSNDEFVVLKEDIKQTKRCKQYTMSEMMNCKVRLVDSKYTILKPNVHPSVLKEYGITSINLPSRCAPADPKIQTLEEIPIIKDTPRSDTKHTSEMDSTQQQTVKSGKKYDDTSRTSDEQGNPVKLKKIQKSQKMNVSVSDKEEYVESNIDDIPVLMNEQAMMDVAQNFWEPDIEIVEEKSIGKTQHQNNLESTLSVIEITDEKEIPRTQYTVHKGPILDIKVFESSFLAASEDGRIYRYSQTSNGILNIYKGHTSAVTCLYVYDSGVTELSKEWMFSGSLDGTLRCYNITSGVQMRDTADIGSPVQCMDQAWGIIFIGTKSGHVSRYHIKSGSIKGSSIQFSDKSVLALKATNEGARRVLIVASRSQPITIRDAQSGLFLRTICGERSHTVYSLMRHNNLIYCGTSSTSILVFDFTNGEQTMQYDAGVGIVCMRLYKQLLFAGCYDGNIYVFDTKDHRLVCSIPGPGNMLLSMEIIDNKIIAGSKDRRLQSWQMPQQVRALLQKIIQKVSTDTS